MKLDKYYHLYGRKDDVVFEEVPNPEPHWIPVTERLPFAEYGESANVLATCRNREQESPDEYRWVRILYFNGGNWCYPTGETYEQQVIAWMPLPDPWKGEQDEP